MQLTQHTEYALRILIYLSLKEKETRSTISEIVDCFSLPKNHIIKIVHKLGKEGFIETTRGKGGGMWLKNSPEDIIIGDVVRKMEVNLELVNCEKPVCPIISVCELIHILNRAKDAFFQVLDLYTIADINQKPEIMIKLLKIHKQSKYDI